VWRTVERNLAVGWKITRADQTSGVCVPRQHGQQHGLSFAQLRACRLQRQKGRSTLGQRVGRLRQTVFVEWWGFAFAFTLARDSVGVRVCVNPG